MHKNIKSVYTDETKGIGKKIGFSFSTKRGNKRWVIYTDFQSSMPFFEYIKENNPMINQIYDILAGLQNHDNKRK